MLSGFHLQVEQIIGRELASAGFALGGGYALQVHGVVERDSKDLDNYTQTMDPAVFIQAEQRLHDALARAGLTAETVSTDSWFRQIIVTNQTGEAVSVDLGYGYRANPPIVVTGVGPVLNVEDVVVGKVRALSDRQAERDYFDIDAILASGSWSIDDLWAKLQVIRPEMTRVDFAQLLHLAHEGDPAEYAALGLSVSDMDGLFGRLQTAAEKLSNR